jgi:hypothetical protein
MTDDASIWLQVLGLEKSASQEEIRRAYRDLAKVWHPDRFVSDARLYLKAEEKLKEINHAYDRLRTYRPVLKQDEATGRAGYSHQSTSDDTSAKRGDDGAARGAATEGEYAPPHSDRTAGAPEATKNKTEDEGGRPLAAAIVALAIVLIIMLAIAVNNSWLNVNTRPVPPLIVAVTPVPLTVKYWYCFEADGLVRVENSAQAATFLESILQRPSRSCARYYTADLAGTQSGYGMRGYSDCADLLFGQHIIVTALDPSKRVNFRIWEQPREERRPYYACGGQ